MTDALLFPGISKLEDLYQQIEAKWDLQRVLLERVARQLWPNGFVGRDGRRLPNPLTRFMASVCPDPETGCWNWTGSMQLNGYGAFPLGGTRHLAHRWIYQTLKGPIAKRLVVDHGCHNKRCVNLAHLEAVTQSVNVIRSLGRPTEIPSFLPSRLSNGAAL